MPHPAHRSGPGAVARPAQTLAYIRQLCCLGLPPETLIVELLQALEWAIPSQSNTFIQIGETGPQSLIAREVVPEAIEAFATQWSSLVSPDVIDLNFRALLEQTVLRDLMEFWPGFANLEMYRLVWRPMGIHHTMQALVHCEGRPAGLLNLSRPRGFTSFRDADRATLLRLLPYVEHGLSPRADLALGPTAVGETGLFILDRRGDLVFSSGQARRLLLLARYPSIPLAPSTRVREPPLPAVVRQLQRDLEAIFRDRPAPPPVRVLDNGRGRFVFRAHWLDPMGPGVEGLAGISIEHQEPLRARLLRGTRRLPLSPTQRDVCVLLAEGASQADLARRLRVKPSTVKDHVSKVYEKLGVNCREDLVALLTREAGLAVGEPDGA